MFDIASARLAAYSVLDLGTGVAVWFTESADLSENDAAWHHAEVALRIVQAGGQPLTPIE